jgi:transposase
VGSPRRKPPGTTASRGRPRTPRSARRQTGSSARTRNRSLTWALTSTAAAGPAGGRTRSPGQGRRPEYGIKHLLEKNLEDLSPEQFAKVIETLDATGPGQHTALAWIGKEKLRCALNLRARVTGSVPCERQVRGRLFSFYDWCAQNEEVTELTTLARTISRWEDQIVTAVLTGVTNARSESLNRIAKLEARHAYGFRNPASQRRRVRTACTRGTRRKAA